MKDICSIQVIDLRNQVHDLIPPKENQLFEEYGCAKNNSRIF